MKIVVVSGGCPSEKYPAHGIFCFDQAKALAQAGHTVILAAVDLRSIRRWRKWGFRSFEKEGVQVEEINLPYGGLPKKLFFSIGKRAFAALYEQIEQKYGRPDVLHAHFTALGYLCGEYANNHGIKLVLTEHSSLVNREVISPATKRLVRVAYSHADRVVAVSSALAKRIYQHSGITATVVPNILDSAVFQSDLPETVRNPGCFHFVTACNLVPLKRISLLLKAFAALSEEDSFLTIFGDGNLRSALEQEAALLGISARVQFRGHCPRSVLQQTYLQSDCFVLPSSSETFGVVYIEAMACGLPVIATRCGGPEDFVAVDNGLLVDVDDLAGLTAAMETMYRTTSDYDSTAIRKISLRRFSAAQIASELTEIYKTL